MATWGDFIAEMPIVRVNAKTMYVPVDNVISLWEERNQLKAKVAQLGSGPDGSEREACAAEVDEFAEACEHEGTEQAQLMAQVLRAAAQMLRDSGQAAALQNVEIPPGEAAVAEEVPLAEPVEETPRQT